MNKSKIFEAWSAPSLDQAMNEWFDANSMIMVVGADITTLEKSNGGILYTCVVVYQPLTAIGPSETKQVKHVQ